MDTSANTIFIVDDDALMRDLLSQALNDAGFLTRVFPTGRAMCAAAEYQACDLILIDLGLPDTDGFTLTADMIERHGCGVIIVTGRQDMDSRLQGLEIGADAYLVKPVEPRELVATVRALLRRIAMERGLQRSPAWRFEPRYWRLVAPDAVSIPLTQTECLLLDVLIRHQGELVERDALVNAMGHSTRYYDSRRLDTVMSRLRRKIQAHSPDWHPILTERGKGYVFVDA